MTRVYTRIFYKERNFEAKIAQIALNHRLQKVKKKIDKKKVKTGAARTHAETK